MNRKPNSIFKVIAIIFVVIVLILVIGSLLMKMAFGWKPFFLLKDCRKGHLISVDYCSGKSSEGWQNSQQYYSLAKGQPKKEFCSSFINETQNLESGVAKRCQNWKEVSCDIYSNEKVATCYVCDYQASNGNTHYYLLAMHNNDCTKGIFFQSSDLHGQKITPEKFKQKLFFNK